MARQFKIVTKPNKYDIFIKKRLFSNIEQFNELCVNSPELEKAVLNKYITLFDVALCYEKVNNKWIEIFPVLGEEYRNEPPKPPK